MRPSLTRSILLTLLLGVPPPPLRAQGPEPFPDEYLVRAFGVEDGLPHRWASRVERTPDGFLFVPTGNGLVRFDGSRFRQVPLPGFASRFLQGTLVDAGGRLWIRSIANDVGYVHEGRLRVMTTVLPPEAHLTSFSATSDGVAWIAGDVLARVTPEPDPRVTIFGAADGLPEGRVVGVYTLPDGERVAVTSHRLARLIADPRAPKGLRFEPVGPRYEALSSAGVFVDAVWSAGVLADAAALWLAVGEGVIKLRDGELSRIDTSTRSPALDPSAFRWGERARRAVLLPLARHVRSPPIPLPGGGAADRVHLLLPARDGTLWLVVTSPANDRRRHHLVRYRDGSYRLVPLRAERDFDSITSLIEDHEGSLWVTTDQGPLQLIERRVTALTERQGLAHGFTTALLESADGSLWVGTWGGGLHRFVGGRLADRLTTRDGLPSDMVRALYQARDGTLWVGTAAGVAEIRDGRVVAAEAGPADRTALGGWPGAVRGIAEDARGTLWRAEVHRLRYRAGAGWRDLRPELWRGKDLWTIVAARDGAIWVGGREGLWRVDGAEVRPYGAADGLRSPFVVSSYEAADGTLWFGTYQHGLHRYRDGRFTALTTAEGLHADGVWCMAEDGDGGVWMSSDRGIFRVARDRLHAVADALERGSDLGGGLSPVVFQETEGAPSRESNRSGRGCAALSGGRLAFNSQAGLTVVDPARALQPVPPPRTVVLRAAVDGRELSTHTVEPPRVPPGSRRLSLEFAAVSYVAPSQTRYRYRLDGYDDGWVDGGADRGASYTGLGPGRYVFRAQAALGAGSWGERGASFSFVVPPRLWQRTPVRIAVALALLALLYAGYRYHLERRLQIERVRLRIAADLHDDVGSSLSSIALMSEMLRDRARPDGPDRHQLARIHDAARETTLALREVIWLVDPCHGNLPELIRRMRAVSGDLLQGMSHAFEAPEVEPRPLAMTFMRSVLLVHKEAVHNAVRHARARHVGVRVDVVGDTLRLTVRDDGRGFDPAARTGGNGLGNMRRRAREIGGNLTIEPTEAGTRLTLEARMA